MITTDGARSEFINYVMLRWSNDATFDSSGTCGHHCFIVSNALPRRASRAAFGSIQSYQWHTGSYNLQANLAETSNNKTKTPLSHEDF